jgi:translation initiation factor IF-3
MSFEEDLSVNRQIRNRQVRVILEDKQLGVFPLEKALKMAQDANLDLVEVSPCHNGPSVCRITDYGKFRYEKQLKKKEQLKKQRSSQVHLKELRLRPVIGKHDMEVKISQAKKFLEDNSKVQFNIVFKGQREMAHKEQGFAVMKQIIESLSTTGLVERNPKFDGNCITCIISPIQAQTKQ